MSRKPVTGRALSPSELGLSERQLKVVALLMKGMSNKAICRSLNLAEPTIKYHIATILRALQVTNRSEAILAISDLGWKFPPAPETESSQQIATDPNEARGQGTHQSSDDSHAASIPSPDPSALPLPNKPSIAVLPFTNLSGDLSQEYFADGVVEDITIALGRIAWLFVIGSGSASTYKNRPIDVRHVGAELGVRYVLRGSVRKADSRVRITAQLMDTSDGGQIWADRFDSELTDIFEIQDRAATQVAAVVAPMMRHVEIERARRKPTGNQTAYDLFLRALPLCRLHNADHSEALSLLNKAIAIDPKFAAPYGLAALCHRAQLMIKRQLPTDPRVAEGIRLAQLAAATGENDPEALWMAGETLLMLAGEIERAQSLVELSIAINPNSASAVNALGILRAYAGDPQAALDHIAIARRLDPIHSFHHNLWVGMALAHFFAERHEECVKIADIVLNERPNYPRALGLKAVSCGLLGWIEKGRQCVEGLLAINPRASVAQFKTMYAPPMRQNPRGLDNYLRGLRASGMPEV